MDNNSKNIKFLRRVDYTDYLADQTVPSGGGDVTNVPITTGLTAYEVEIDGRRVVLLGYDTQN